MNGQTQLALPLEKKCVQILCAENIMYIYTYKFGIIANKNFYLYIIFSRKLKINFGISYIIDYYRISEPNYNFL